MAFGRVVPPSLAQNRHRGQHSARQEKKRNICARSVVNLTTDTTVASVAMSLCHPGAQASAAHQAKHAAISMAKFSRGTQAAGGPAVAPAVAAGA